MALKKENNIDDNDDNKNTKNIIIWHNGEDINSESSSEENNTVDDVSDCSFSSDNSFKTDEKIENMIERVMNSTDKIMKINYDSKFLLYVLLYVNIIGWTVLMVLDPIRLIIKYPEAYNLKSDTCEMRIYD